MTNVREYKEVKTVFGAAEDMETNERATTDKVVEWTAYHVGIPTAAYLLVHVVFNSCGKNWSPAQRANFEKEVRALEKKHGAGTAKFDDAVKKLLTKKYRVSAAQAVKDLDTYKKVDETDKLSKQRTVRIQEIMNEDGCKTQRVEYEKAKKNLDTVTKNLEDAQGKWLKSTEGRQFVANLEDGPVKTAFQEALNQKDGTEMSHLRKKLPDLETTTAYETMVIESEKKIQSHYEAVKTANGKLDTARTDWVDSAEKLGETDSTIQKIDEKMLGSVWERAGRQREKAFKEAIVDICNGKRPDCISAADWDKLSKAEAVQRVCDEYGVSNRSCAELKKAINSADQKGQMAEIGRIVGSDDVRLFTAKNGIIDGHLNGSPLRTGKAVIHWGTKGLAALGALSIVVGAYTYGRDELKLRDEVVGEITSLAENPEDAKKYFTKTAEQNYRNVLTWIERNLPEDAKEDRAFIQKMRSMIDYPERYEAKGQLEFRKALQQTFDTYRNEIKNSRNSQSQTFNVSTTGNDTTAASEEGNDTTAASEEGNDTTAEEGNDTTAEEGNGTTTEEGNDTTTDDAPTTKYSGYLEVTQTSSKPNVRRGLEQFKVPEDETTTGQMFDRGSRNT